MKKYKIETSKTANHDIDIIISYIREELLEDDVAEKYKRLFTEKLKQLVDIAGSMPPLDEELTGHKGIRKVNVKNYIMFYTIDEEKDEAYVIRVGHAFMDWQKYLKNI